MYPSGVLSKLCNEHFRHYSTILNYDRVMHISPQVGESDKFLLVESGIQFKESGIPLTIGIQNPSSTNKDWNPVPGIRNPQRGIQNPRLSWIPLYMGRHIANVTSAVCRRKQDRSLLLFTFPSLRPPAGKKLI